MLPQPHLKILLTLYNRRVEDVARAAGISAPYASLLLNCQKPATPEMIARLEQAILGERVGLLTARREAVQP